MEIILKKTMKIKQVNKIRKNLFLEKDIESFTKYDNLATHQLIYIDDKLISSVSYFFDNKIILIYGLAFQEKNRPLYQKIIEMIKEQTKHFNCDYKIISQI